VAQERKVAKIVEGYYTQDGAGVNLHRVLSLPTVKDFDPFLMLDAFDSTNPEDYIKGFPWHPHRGIETVTYLIEGEIDHGDSLGNRGAITNGACQWMTAGSGIIHQEMPQPTPRLLGAQLWINLPKKQKMTQPAYRDIKSSLIPVVKEEGVKIRIISGEYKGAKGEIMGGAIKTTYLDVALNPKHTWEMKTDPEETVFIYIVEGALDFEGKGEFLEDRRAVLLTKGDSFKVVAGPNGCARFLVYAAKPLGEPVAWGGPIVMNTEEELGKAFEELENGAFIKHKLPVSKDYYSK
jgi:redox-sensitive bicupin YhaK (pirin superfamily)